VRLVMPRPRGCRERAANEVRGKVLGLPFRVREFVSYLCRFLPPAVSRRHARKAYFVRLSCASGVSQIPRLSDVAILGLGAALPAPSAPAALQRRAVAFGSVQRAPRSQVVVPGGRLPGPPGADGYEPPAAGRHAPLRLQDRLRRRPSMSEAGNRSSIVTIRSQESS